MRMKKLLAILLCVLCFTSFALAEPAKQMQYKLHLSVDNTAFPANIHKDWKAFLEKFSVSGEMCFESLFTKQEKIDGTAHIFVRDKKLLHIEHLGNQQYVSINSHSLGYKIWYFNFHNFYEFMLKPYFFMGLPTQYIALLAYPFGAYKAISNMQQFLAEHIYKAESTEISFEELQTIAQAMSAFFDEEYISYQFMRSLMMESGLFEGLYYDFQSAEEYLETIAMGEGMQVVVEDGVSIYTLAEQEILRIEKTANGKQLHLHMPTGPSGMEYVLDINQTFTENTQNITAKFSIIMDEVESVYYTLEASDLPTATSTENHANIKLATGGDMIGEEKALQFGLDLQKQGENINAILSFIDPASQKKVISLHAEATITDATEAVKERPFVNEDFFSLNDVALKTLKGDLYPYIKSIALPMLLETPIGVLQDILHFLDSSGILSTIFAK